jgi:oligopeptide transport system ATP-binding protein
MAERVLVMYAGFIVEEAPVSQIYARPYHPYTLGLLRSIPRLDLGRQKRLVPIDGLPPDLLDAPTACPFAARCDFVKDRCREENPPLEQVDAHRRVACWYWKEVAETAVRVVNAVEVAE